MDDIKRRVKEGSLIPFLGMGVFEDFKAKDGSELPYDSDSMVLALNNGRAMSPRLMYEYTRAAMSLEQRKGREFLVQMTNHVYASKEYDLPLVYEKLKALQPPYLIDTNMDDSACKVYEEVEHFMITGVSRIMADYDRFLVYKYNLESKAYEKIDKSMLHSDAPILFKPMGSMIPDMNFIVSDADFVDWLTEAMGGYAMPELLKEYRKGKDYLFLGVDFSKDTFRMVANEITLDLKESVFVTQRDELSKKEIKFLSAHQAKILKSDLAQLDL